MKISIVTISYNQAEYLEKAILSVLEQSDVELEYIVVDPGSTDGSREIIDKYRSSFAKVIFEQDEGPADGLNKGFSFASGDWFGYLNADDLYLPNALATVSEYAKRGCDAGALVGHGYIVDSDDRFIRLALSQRFSLRASSFGGAFALQQATFYRASAFRALNGFNKSNKTCWDSEILIDLAKAGFPILRLNKYLGAFRIHASSITGSGRLSSQYLMDQDMLFKKVQGRKPTWLDRQVRTPVSKFAQHISDPMRVVLLLRERLISNRVDPRGT